MQEIDRHDGLQLQVIATGSMLLERFYAPVHIVQSDGFTVDGRIHVEVEGSTPNTMAKSIGLAVIEFASEFQRLRPDIVLVIGDRYEALGAVIAAAYMNLCIVHVQGGEVSGSIDESARHAITKFSHFHVPATRRAAEYLERMGERPDTILAVGCPSSDIAFHADMQPSAEILNSRGRGAEIDSSRPFLLVVFHPTTTEYGREQSQVRVLLEALERISMQTVVLWPNIDAGSQHISKEIRVYRDRVGNSWLRNLTNLPPEDYLKVLASAACAVGNSSSFVRDAGYFGTPVVLLGRRQEGREWDRHVTPVGGGTDVIEQAIRNQLAGGRYSPSTLYGDGHVAPRIVNALAKLDPYIQKRLAYVDKVSGTKDQE
jgi:UDP-hydrolysing UDP-N-acetyl-D-glucosamine 2-epimerase